MVFAYDIEDYKNFFCATFLDLYSDTRHQFIIDDYVDQSREMKEFIKGKWLIGYNSKHFDNVIINYITKLDKAPHVRDIYDFVQKIIQLKDTEALYKHTRAYKYNDSYQSIDLMTMLFSKALRVSLKVMEVNINFDNVQELPYPYDAVLTAEQKLVVLEYNLNDCRATKEVALKSMNDIKLRHKVKEEYGIDAYSLDGVRTAVTYLSKEYCLLKGIDLKEFMNQRYPFETIHVKDIIHPFISFTTPQFKKVLEYYESFVVHGKDSYPSYEVMFNGVLYQLGSGGIHSIHNPEVVTVPKGKVYFQSDVGSMYPTAIIEHGCLPKQLDSAVFMPIYKIAYVGKSVAKKAGDKLTETFEKLKLNSFFGQMLNEHGPFHDPKAALKITINNQLMLLMLVEMLFNVGIKVIAANTDAVEVLIDESQVDLYLSTCATWESLTRFTLDHDKVVKMVRRDINNYLMITEKGKVKKNGLFITEPRLGKGYSFFVIPKAIEKYFLEGIPVEETIRKHDNIYDFLKMQKVGKQFSVEWNGKKIQNINRFYIQKTGAYIYKVKGEGHEKSYHNILKDLPVMVFNKFIKKDMKDYNIWYEYYISEAKKIVEELEPSQLSLF
jgi:hypothetical protein